MDIGSFGMRWDIVGIGWARLTWSADDDVLEIRTSDTGHGLESLLQAAADLHRGSSASLAWLPSEPYAHVFVFTGAAEYVHVQILHLPDEYAEDPWSGARRLWSGRVAVASLSAAAVRMGQAVLDEYGEAGYRKAWSDMPFPSHQVAMLQSDSGR